MYAKKDIYLHFYTIILSNTNKMRKLITLIIVLSLSNNVFSQVSEYCNSFTIDNSVKQKRIQGDSCTINILLNPSSDLWLGIAENQVIYIYPKNFDENNTPKIDIEYCKNSVLKVDFRVADNLTVHSIIGECQIFYIKIPTARTNRR